MISDRVSPPGSPGGDGHRCNLRGVDGQKAEAATARASRVFRDGLRLGLPELGSELGSKW